MKERTIVLVMSFVLGAVTTALGVNVEVVNKLFCSSVEQGDR